MKKRLRQSVSWFLLLATTISSAVADDVATKGPPYDVVVYGGTSGGIVAAVQAAKMKRSVVLIEPSKHLGGLTSSGLGATDIGNKGAIGGLSRGFYRSIVPKKSQCENLLVPICLAASHISYGSIRMEPVFMVLGQSAATAACFAIDGNRAVQDVVYSMLRERLLADGQVLVWTGPRRSISGIDPLELPGLVIDNVDAKLTGEPGQGLELFFPLCGL